MISISDAALRNMNPRYLAQAVLSEYYNEKQITYPVNPFQILTDFPTIHGLLAIGKSPQTYIPGAYIQFLRIDGLQLDDPVIDEEMISVAIPEIKRNGNPEPEFIANNDIVTCILRARSDHSFAHTPNDS